MASGTSISSANRLLTAFLASLEHKPVKVCDIKDVRPPTMAWIGAPCPPHRMMYPEEQGLFTSLTGCNSKLWELFKFSVPPFPAPHFYNLTYDETIPPDNNLCVALSYVFWIDCFGMALYSALHKNPLDAVTNSKKGNSKKVKTWNEMADNTLKTIKMIFYGKFVEELGAHDVCQDVEKFLLDPCMISQLPWKPILFYQWLLASLSLVRSFELQTIPIRHWPLSEEVLLLANNLLSSVCKLKERIMLGFGIVTEHVIAYPNCCDDKFADIILDVVVLPSIPMLELLLNGTVHHMILQIKVTSWKSNSVSNTSYLSVSSYRMLPTLENYNIDFAYNFRVWTMDHIPNLFPKLSEEVVSIAAKLRNVKSTHPIEVGVVKPLSLNEKYLLSLTERAYKMTSSEERIKLALQVIQMFVLVELPGLTKAEVSRKLNSAKSKKQASEVFDKIKPELVHHIIRHALMYHHLYKMLINFDHHKSIAGQIIFKQMFILEQEQVVRLTNICSVIFQIKPVLAQKIVLPHRNTNVSKSEAEISSTLPTPEVNIDKVSPSSPDCKLESVLTSLDSKPVSATSNISVEVNPPMSTLESKIDKEKSATNVNSIGSNCKTPENPEASSNSDVNINSKVPTGHENLNSENPISESLVTTADSKMETKDAEVASVEHKSNSTENGSEASSSEEIDSPDKKKQPIPNMSSKRRKFLPSSMLYDSNIEEMLHQLRKLQQNVPNRADIWAKFDSVWQKPIDMNEEVPGTVQNINDVIHILLDKVGRIVHDLSSKKFSKLMPYVDWTMLQFVIPAMIRGLKEDPAVLFKSQDFCFFPLVASTVQYYENMYLAYLSLPNRQIILVRNRRNNSDACILRQYEEWSVLNKKVTSDINTVIRLLFTFTGGKSCRFREKFKSFCKFSWGNFHAMYSHGVMPFRQVFDIFYNWHAHVFVLLNKLSFFCSDEYVMSQPGSPMPTYPELGELYLACEVVMEIGAMCHMSATYITVESPVLFELQKVDFKFRSLILSHVMLEHRNVKQKDGKRLLQLNQDKPMSEVCDLYRILKKYRQSNDQIKVTLKQYLPMSKLYDEVRNAVELFYEGKLDELEHLIPILKEPEPEEVEIKQGKICRNCDKMETKDTQDIYLVCETCIEDQYPDVNYYCSNDCKKTWWKIEHMAEHLEFDLGLSDFSHLKLNDEPNTSHTNMRQAARAVDTNKLDKANTQRNIGLSDSDSDEGLHYDLTAPGPEAVEIKKKKSPTDKRNSSQD